MEFRYHHAGNDYTVQLDPQPDGSYLVTIGDRQHRVELKRIQDGQLNFAINNRRLHAYTAQATTEVTGTEHLYIALVDTHATHYDLTKIQAGSARRRRAAESEGSLKAQMPGQVMEVLAAEGDSVTNGQTLLVLEAMKMEIRVKAPYDGVLARLLVKKGDTTERGQLLAEVEVHS
jgi:biotin carboxyl carrier protein